MKNYKGIRIFLILASIIGLYVGIGLVFFPVELQAQSNIIIDGNPSHLSETRAPGSAILSASIFILIGAFRKKWTYISLIITALFFLSYGSGRLLSLILDGMPAEGLFATMIGELAVGLIALILVGRVKPSYVNSVAETV